MIKKVLISLSVATIVSVAVLVMLIAVAGFPFRYMDLDESGFVSVGEAIRTLDLGVREKIEAGQTCVEIFELKDGQPVKLICEDFQNGS